MLSYAPVIMNGNVTTDMIGALNPVGTVWETSAKNASLRVPEYRVRHVIWAEPQLRAMEIRDSTYPRDRPKDLQITCA